MIRECDKRTQTEFIRWVVYSQVISEKGAVKMGYLEKASCSKTEKTSRLVLSKEERNTWWKSNGVDLFVFLEFAGVFLS